MAQDYEIDIKRFNGQDYDTLLPTPAAHASTHQAGGSDPITMQTGNYANGSVTNEKLANSSVTAGKIASGAVTEDKIAQGAICVGAASFTLSTADWTLNEKGVYEQNKTTTLDVSPEKHIGFLGLTRGLLHYPGDGSTTWGWSQSLIAADREKIACLYSASLIATNTIKFVATEIPDGSLYVTILFFRR